MPKISALTDATTIANADEFPIVQSGTTKRITALEIFAAPPAIGGTTPAAGSFTTLSASGSLSTSEDGNGLFTLGRFSAGYPWSILRASTNSNGIEIRDFIGNTQAQFSSTGLAVTGEVSATTAIKTADATTLYWGAGSAYIQGSSASSYVAINTGSTQRGLFNSTGLAVTGAISTTDPAGGAGPAWKLGVAASVSPTSPNRTLRVDIGGTTYYIAAKTTND